VIVTRLFRAWPREARRPVRLPVGFRVGQLAGLGKLWLCRVLVSGAVLAVLLYPQVADKHETRSDMSDVRLGRLAFGMCFVRTCADDHFLQNGLRVSGIYLLAYLEYRRLKFLAFPRGLFKEEGAAMIIRKGKSQITFVYAPDNACRQVFLAGSFNDWIPEKGKMIRQKDGSFRKRLRLPPGEYRYKFLVDGQWVADSSGEGQVPNEFGTFDSVVRVG